MDAVFLKILNMSITACWLILAIILIRLLLRKAPKWIACALWGVAAFKLVCPFSFKSALSLIPASEPVNMSVYSGRPYIQSGITFVDKATNDYIANHYSGGAAVAAQESSANPLNIIAIIWIGGVAVLLLYALISYLRLRKRVAASVPVEDRIMECDDIPYPFILGVIKPRIYIPSSLDEEARSFVVTHEMAHIKRRDYWWKPLGFLILCIHWFNPLCWVAYILLCRDIEMACDEKVIKDMDRDEKAGYSQTLLDLGHVRRIITACPVAFGEIGVKERIKSVLNYKKPAFGIIPISVIICIAIAVCFLTNPKEEKDITVLQGEYTQGEVETLTTGGADANSDKASYVSKAEPETDSDLFKQMKGEYWFLSGAGGWSTRIYINDDGTFDGIYEDYSATLIERCKFHGMLQAPSKASEYIYISQISELIYDEPGIETQEGEYTVTTAKPYGLENSQAIYIYLPGMKVSDLTESELLCLTAEREEFWDKSHEDAINDVLPCFGISNISNEEEKLFTQVPEQFASANQNN